MGKRTFVWLAPQFTVMFLFAGICGYGAHASASDAPVVSQPITFGSPA